MDKQQKQIEEIEQFLARKILGGKAWNTRDIAKGVYELITKNAVVLTREEYKRLLKEETLCERLGNDIDVKLKYIHELEDKVAQERKETVEKIVNDISNDIIVVNTKEYGNIEVVPVERLQEIIQTLGVNE